MKARARQGWWRRWLLFALAAMACSGSPKVESPALPVASPPEPDVLLPWDGPPVWMESSMVKIRPDAAPGSQRELFLFAARNEFVSFQVAFQGGQKGWKAARVSLPALQGPDVISGQDILLYRETFLDITKTSGVDLMTKGRWPDGLIPDVDEFTGEQRSAFPFDVPPGEARAVWVDVHVPADARPGNYRGVILVTTQDGATVDLRIHVTVVDALLPSTPSMRTAFFLGPQYVCRAFTGNLDCGEDKEAQLLPLFHRLGLEHRITLAGGFPNLSGHAIGEQQNWRTFETLWGPFLDGTAPLSLPGARVTAWKYVGPFSSDALTDFAQQSRERGWLPRAFHYVGDEPPYWSTFEQVRQRATLTRQVAPELRTLLASNIDVLTAQNLEDVIDIIVVLVNHMDKVPAYGGDQRSRYDEFLSRPNRELWLYQSCESHGCVGTSVPENRPGQGWPSYMIDRSAAKARAMEWASFLEGATGELYYQTAERLDSAWTDQYLFFGNGDGTLFYPGTPATIGGTTQVPVPSLRLKLIRLGLQDYEWLVAVRDAGDPDYARRVARRVIPKAWLVPDDGAVFEQARLCLMRRYLELKAPTLPIMSTPALTVPCPEDFTSPPGG